MKNLNLTKKLTVLTKSRSSQKFGEKIDSLNMPKFSWLIKTKYSSLNIKLESSLNSISSGLTSENKNEILQVLSQYNYLFNEITNKDKEFMRQIIKKLSSGNLIHKIVSLIQFFNQKEINTVSTFLLSMSRESTNDALARYFMEHPNTFQILKSFMIKTNLCSASNILIRECMKQEKFARFLFKTSFYLKLFELSINKEFEIAVSAIKTFQELFSAYPDLSSASVAENYATFSAHLLTILSKGSFVVRATMLPFLVKYLIDPKCSNLLEKLLVDQLFLMQVLKLMSHKSRKIYIPAYSLFKVIMFKQSTPGAYKKILQPNKEHILRNLKKIDISDDDDLRIEHHRLILRL